MWYRSYFWSSKKIITKDLESSNLNIWEIPMSWTSSDLFEIYAAVRTTETKKACHLSVLSIIKEYYLFKSLLNDAAMVWRNLINKITSSLSYIHNTSSILQLLWYLYIKNKTKKLQHNVFQFILPFFSLLHTYFVLYLVWYVYDNTYNLIVDYSQFIINLSIYNIICWFAGPIGQMTHWAIFLCSKY